MNTDIETEQTPTVEEESTAVKETAENVVQPPETVEVKLLRYNNGMENWHGETQMLFCPQFENGRNVLPLYGKDVEFTITITDRYDKTKTIKLHPSSFFGEGVARGLAIIRFQPCVEEGENFWVPERGQSYWMAFTAIGTDGKLYISNECEMFLQPAPVLHGRLFNTGEAASANMGGNPPQGVFEELNARIDNLECQINDVESSSEDLENTLEEKIDELKEELQNNTSSKQEKSVADDVTPAFILQKIDDLENSFTQRLKTVIDSIVSPEDVDDADYDVYLDAIRSVTVQLNDAHTQSLAVYAKLLDKLTDCTMKTPREKCIEEQADYIRKMPDEMQVKMFPALWALALGGRSDDAPPAVQTPDDEDGEE